MDTRLLLLAAEAEATQPQRSLLLNTATQEEVLLVILDVGEDIIMDGTADGDGKE
jgi:hypothetical protein